MSTVPIQAHSLYRFFHVGDDETFALQGVSLSLRPGEIAAVTGPSGSGKSTLLACLAGLDEPDGGHVAVEGVRLTRRPESVRARLRAAHIGMLFQQTNLVGHLSVADNGTAWREEVHARCGSDHRAGNRAPELSGGELARAGLAVALANDPAVILADEPTGELDAISAGRILELLRDRAHAGAAVLIVTHSEEVAGVADREIGLLDGRIER